MSEENHKTFEEIDETFPVTEELATHFENGISDDKFETIAVDLPTDLIDKLVIGFLNNHLSKVSFGVVVDMLTEGFDVKDCAYYAILNQTLNDSLGKYASKVIKSRNLEKHKEDEDNGRGEK